MTDINTVLAQISNEQAALQTSLAAAVAQGGQASAVAAATRSAAAAVQSLAARITAEQALIAADGATVTSALTARNGALAAVVAARTDGDQPPLADAQAATLKTAVATANSVTEANLDSKGVAAVTTLDAAIAGLGNNERTQLNNAQAALVTKQKALVDARAAALTLLAKIQGSAADTTLKLGAAVEHYGQAGKLAQATGAASHHAAVVAYAGYVAERTALAADLAADPDGTVLQGKWTSAANTWLSALADVGAAEEKVIEKQLALNVALAKGAAKLQTRDSDAAAAVGAAVGP
ncbi:hypothetical protein [Caulobacter zeae]|uniref:hypothetical protein n=1 Tax=Caulobacter zeae TaxID=2055137 RepID=UPI000E421D64|nr:hypothetical protein [Caulobacter zeae]